LRGLRLKWNICAYNTANKRAIRLAADVPAGGYGYYFTRNLRSSVQKRCLMNNNDEVESKLEIALATIVIRCDIFFDNKKQHWYLYNTQSLYQQFNIFIYKHDFATIDR